MRWTRTMACACFVSACGGRLAGASAETSDASTNDSATAFDVPSSFDVAPSDACASKSIELHPDDAIAVLDLSTSPPTPATQSFTAALAACGALQDVTAEIALRADDASIGSFVGNLFTSATKLPPGDWRVTTTVRASAEGVEGRARLTVLSMRVGGDHPDASFSEGACAFAPGRFVLKTHARTLGNYTTSTTYDPTNPVDATTTVAPVRAMTEGDATNGCAPHAGIDSDGDGVVDTFTDATDVDLCFEVAPRGAHHPPSMETIGAFVDVVAASDPSFHDRRLIVIELGPALGAPC